MGQDVGEGRRDRGDRPRPVRGRRVHVAARRPDCDRAGVGAGREVRSRDVPGAHRVSQHQRRGPELAAGSDPRRRADPPERAGSGKGQCFQRAHAGVHSARWASGHRAVVRTRDVQRHQGNRAAHSVMRLLLVMLAALVMLLVPRRRASAGSRRSFRDHARGRHDGDLSGREDDVGCRAHRGRSWSTRAAGCAGRAAQGPLVGPTGDAIAVVTGQTGRSRPTISCSAPSRRAALVSVRAPGAGTAFGLVDRRSGSARSEPNAVAHAARRWISLRGLFRVAARSVSTGGCTVRSLMVR